MALGRAACLALWWVAALPADGAERDVAAAQNGARATASRLVDAGSPYLLQHADNPVDWYPWGEEALDKARREGKPIFVSIGYSACHWCHIANRTLYSNPEIAALMNRWFVNIKVDREQRPDLDALYMLATKLMTGRGGWPNNLFLTPDLKPFFAGSYFPPADDAFGRPGFARVLRGIHSDWSERRGAIERKAEETIRAMQAAQQDGTAAARPVDAAAWLAAAIGRLEAEFDREHGGFQPARDDGAKFPHEPLLALLVADVRAGGDRAARDMLVATLDAMARGGVHDHLGGGFHRYAVERSWSLPHFEKMLYDNAQLLRVYAEAWQLTREPLYREVAERTGDYLLRRLAAPDGGFYTAEDAEAEARDGASYLWTSAEIEAALGGEAARAFLSAYAITPVATQREDDVLDGVVRGVLRVRRPPPADDLPAALAGHRARLLAAREAREQPARDEKLVLALNGLAIDAFVAAARILGKPAYLQAAERTASRLWSLAYDERGRTLHHEVYRGEARGAGFLDDYAHFGVGLAALADATGELAWRRRAALLADDALRLFAREDGGLAMASAQQALPIVPIERGDDPYPSGTSATVRLLLLLAREADGAPYLRAAERVLAALSARVQDRPEQWPALVATAVELRTAALARHATGPRAPLELPDSANHVAIDTSFRRLEGHDEIVVALRIAPGFHVNANPASYDYLIPTAIRFAGLEPAHIRYPPGRLFRPAFATDGLMVYEGELELVAEFRSGALAERKAIEGELGVQACDDRVCLPPATLPVSLTLP